jgi:hypothetical protein
LHVWTLEIIRSRDGSWDGVVSRRHEITKVYACNESADDLLFIGFVVIQYANGQKVDGSFVVRAVVDDPKSQSPRLSLYQGWMVSHASVTPQYYKFLNKRLKIGLDRDDCSKDAAIAAVFMSSLEASAPR